MHAFNQRDLAGIYAMIVTVGALVGVPEKGVRLAADLRERVAAIAARSAQGARPRVYFEEWDEPMISGIGWVSELVEVAGEPMFFPNSPGAKPQRPDRERGTGDRIPPRCRHRLLVGRNSAPNCLPPAPVSTRCRPCEAVVYARLSVPILQPGPAALTDGLAIAAMIGKWKAVK